MKHNIIDRVKFLGVINRKLLPKYYSRNGLCYAVRREQIFQKDSIVDQDSAGVVINRDVINIDTELELKIAELLLKNINEKK